MNLLKFEPWVNANSIIAELNECCDTINLKVSNEHLNVEDIAKAISKVEPFNQYTMWLHPTFIVCNCGAIVWIVGNVDKAYYDDDFGDDTITVCAYDGDTEPIAD